MGQSILRGLQGKDCLRENDNDYSWRGIPRKLRPRFCDCVSRSTTCTAIFRAGRECRKRVRSVVATKWASIFTRYDWSYSTGNKSRSRHPSRGKGGQRENERKREMSQWRYRGEWGYIIYIGLKGLHKNVWSTKKDDCTRWRWRRGGSASWFDAPYREKHVQDGTQRIDKGPIVKPAALRLRRADDCNVNR